jgi:hypothetical protein
MDRKNVLDVKKYRTLRYGGQAHHVFKKYPASTGGVLRSARANTITAVKAAGNSPLSDGAEAFEFGLNGRIQDQREQFQSN